MKRKIFQIGFLLTLVLCLAACSTGESGSSKETDETPPQSALNESDESAETTEPDETEESDGSIKSGTYTLPCGMKIQFFDSVRNDVTGNWRRATTSDSFVPADYALEYYNEMFSSNEEIHSIWNATLGTNTRISIAFGMLYVDTFEYVKGEEHDANIMFSGTLLTSKIIDVATGEEIEE